MRGRLHGGRHRSSPSPSAGWSAGSATSRSRKAGQRSVHRAEPVPASASSDPGPPAWRAPPTWPRRAATSPSTRPSTSRAACCKYGIPDFRLPNTVVDAEIGKLEQLGVKFECNTLVGRLFTIEQMIDEMGFHAVFIGTGAGYPSFMGIPGESLNGVLSANELLTRCNLMHARDFPNFDTPLQPGRRVAVIGAGNTAMDALRVCLRLGAEKVHCVYRRTAPKRRRAPRKSTTPRRKASSSTGSTSPVEILDDGNGSVRGMRCVRMALGEPDESGRRRPVPVAGQRVRDRGRHGRLRDRHQRQPDHRPDLEAQARTSAATSRPTRTSRPRWPACSPAATSSPAPPR